MLPSLRLNGVEVLNMQQLVALVVQLTSSGTNSPGSGTNDPTSSGSAEGGAAPTAIPPTAAFLRFDFSDGSVMVLDGATIRAETLEVLREQSISHAMSAGLRRAAAAAGVAGARHWPEDERAGHGAAVGAGEGRQVRQQKRRLTVRR